MTASCNRCQSSKPVEQFARRNNRRSGRASVCKECTAAYVREYYKTHKRPRKTPEANRERNLRKLYGITSEEFDVMLSAQDGTCKVCNGPALGRGTYHVDHCHQTGRIRGLLCHKCNVALGMVSDSPERLRSLISYLELTA